MLTIIKLPSDKNRISTRLLLTFILIATSLLSSLSTILQAPSAQAVNVGEYNWRQIRTTDMNSSGDKLDIYGRIAVSTDMTKQILAEYDGYIYTSSDSGTTWEVRTQAGKREWMSVGISGDGSTFMAGVASNGGYLYLSRDNGATWDEKTNFGISSWSYLYASHDGSKLAAVKSSQLVVSEDGGNTWQTRSFQFDWYTPLAMSSDGTKLIVKGTNRLLYKSQDGGITWQSLPTAGVRYWSNIALSPNGTTIIATADDSSIYISTDGGATWQSRPQTKEGGGWNSLSASDTGQYLTASTDWSNSEEGALYNYSDDFGATWQTKRLGATKKITKLMLSGDGKSLTAASDDSRGGSVYTSANSGQTWTRQTIIGNGNWSALAASGDGRVILAAQYDYGVLSLSTDYGKTWKQQSISAAYSGWYNIGVSKDGSTLVATDTYGTTNWDGGYAYISTDYGETWVQQTELGARYWIDWRSGTTSVSDDGKTIVIGDTYGADWNDWDGGYIYITKDRGAHWEPALSLGANNWISVNVSGDGKTIIAASGNGSTGGAIFTSHDAGQTWTEHASINTPESIWYNVGISSDGTHLLASQSGGRLFTSNNSGESWVERVVPDIVWQLSALSLDGSTILASATFNERWGNNSHLMISQDFGDTWKILNELPTQGWDTLAVSENGAHIVAGSWHGYLYTGTLTLPSLTFTPTLESTNTPVAPSSTNPAAPQTVNNKLPTFTGVTFPNSPVKVTVHSDPIVCETTSDAQGNWSCTLPVSIPEGNHTVRIELTNPITSQTMILGPYYIQVPAENSTIITRSTELIKKGRNTLEVRGAAPSASDQQDTSPQATNTPPVFSTPQPTKQFASVVTTPNEEKSSINWLVTGTLLGLAVIGLVVGSIWAIIRKKNTPSA